MLQRRGLLAGLGALLAAPAIIRTPGLLMPVRVPIVSAKPLLTINMITQEALKILHNKMDFRADMTFAMLDRIVLGPNVRVRLPLNFSVNQNPVDNHPLT